MSIQDKVWLPIDEDQHSPLLLGLPLHDTDPGMENEGEKSIRDYTPVKMKLSFKTLVGKTVSLDVDEETTIKQIKNMLEAKLELAASMQRLIYAQKDLENEHSLAELHIPDGTCLWIVSKSLRTDILH